MQATIKRRYGPAETAAERGNPEGQILLGKLHYDGHGLPQDYSAAARWYGAAAAQGDAAAQLGLGNLYQRGFGVSQDYREAWHWYRRAADQGAAGAQWALGNLYKDGLGVAADSTEAAAWCRLASDQGFAPAECNLGRLYEAGAGIERDDARAADLYRRSANKDYLQAKIYLAHMYSRGRGVAQDCVAAHMWANLALTQMQQKPAREHEARFVAELEARMAPEQVEEARRRAAEWRPSGDPLTSSAEGTRVSGAGSATPGAGDVLSIVIGAVGFVAGFCAVFFLEGLVLSGFEGATRRHVMPRGLGWIVAPFLVGVMCWHLGRSLASRRRRCHLARAGTRQSHGS